MVHSSEIRKFQQARLQTFNTLLITSEELEYVRKRMDDVGKDYYFCDGCGLCCSDDAVTLTGMEFSRIQDYIKEKDIPVKPRSFVCPFLDFNYVKYQSNLRVFRDEPEKVQPLYCRIYPERPMVCRLFPSGIQCRENSSFVSPKFYELLEDCRDIIDRYFFNLWREGLKLPQEAENILDMKYALYPSWFIDEENSAVEYAKGAYGFATMEKAWWRPPSHYDYTEEQISILKEFTVPTSFSEVLRKYSKGKRTQELTTFLTESEFRMIIGPADFRFMDQTFNNFWEHFSRISDRKEEFLVIYEQ